MELWEILAVSGAGLLAGFINTLAGSGSLLTLPVLMFLGLPANVANGTNRIAILLQNVVGVASFKQQKAFNFTNGIWQAIPAIAGSIIGALIAIEINHLIMEKIIGGLLFLMFILILIKPSAWLKNEADKHKGQNKIIQIFIFFLIGLYGGFIQAGTGLFLLAGLVLSSGFDLVKANAIKLFIILIYTPFALSIFIFNDQVDFRWGLILAAGNMLGALIASRLAIKKGAQFIRWFLLLAILISAVKLTGLIG